MAHWTKNKVDEPPPADDGEPTEEESLCDNDDDIPSTVDKDSGDNNGVFFEHEWW